ncbi:MAG: amino acid ABC transporter permease [Butyricicoccaceae bacterium]
MTVMQILEQLSQGMVVTFQIFFSTLFFSLVLGLGIALCRMTKNPVISFIAKVYISIMRGTPLMLQLLVVYFGPYFLFGVPISSSYRLTAVLIGFALNYAAYFAEIYRSGIEAIPKGQYEAAKLLGYNRLQTFFLIVMPQVIKRIIPPVTNETITLVKDTSLAFTLAVAEVFTLTKEIVSSQSSMIPFVVAGVFYYVVNLLVAFLSSLLEKKLSYYQ